MGTATEEWAPPTDRDLVNIAFTYEVLRAIHDERLQLTDDRQAWCYNDGTIDDGTEDLFDGTMVLDEVYDLRRDGFVAFDGALPVITKNGEAWLDLVDVLEIRDLTDERERANHDYLGAAREHLILARMYLDKHPDRTAPIETYGDFDQYQFFLAATAALAHQHVLES